MTCENLFLVIDEHFWNMANFDTIPEMAVRVYTHSKHYISKYKSKLTLTRHNY